MREILFRGKRADNGEWVEGYLYRLSEKHNPFIMVKNKCGESHEVLPETVGQYTGLTDKNGKKIFEDDILTIEGVNIYGAIKCREDKSAFFVETENGEGYFGENWDTDVVVIGNFHDNPELVGGAE